MPSLMTMTFSEGPGGGLAAWLPLGRADINNKIKVGRVSEVAFYFSQILKPSLVLSE